MANNKIPVCVVPEINKCVLEQGKEGLKYLKERTKENPFFAIATGALHSGPIKYDRQQKFVEKVSKTLEVIRTPLYDFVQWKQANNSRNPQQFGFRRIDVTYEFSSTSEGYN